MNYRQDSLVGAAYKVAVGQYDLAPSEFWAMHPVEFWWFIEAKNPQAFVTTVDDWQDLYDMLD